MIVTKFEVNGTKNFVKISFEFNDSVTIPIPEASYGIDLENIDKSTEDSLKSFYITPLNVYHGLNRVSKFYPFKDAITVKEGIKQINFEEKFNNDYRRGIDIYTVTNRYFQV
uniref:Phage protein n=1 Tax=Meloidogyne hapla TaxID=6305 RepID=A0A1I8BV34_MELHA